MHATDVDLDRNEWHQAIIRVLIVTTVSLYLDELTPRNWKRLFADNPLRSDLDRVTGVNGVVV